MIAQQVKERWDARRRMALWSFRLMCVLAVWMTGYGMFYPGGAALLLSISPLVLTLFTSFTAIVGAYMGMDGAGIRHLPKPNEEQ